MAAPPADPLLVNRPAIRILHDDNLADIAAVFGDMRANLVADAVNARVNFNLVPDPDPDVEDNAMCGCCDTVYALDYIIRFEGDTYCEDCFDEQTALDIHGNRHHREDLLVIDCRHAHNYGAYMHQDNAVELIDDTYCEETDPALVALADGGYAIRGYHDITNIQIGHHLDGWYKIGSEQHCDACRLILGDHPEYHDNPLYADIVEGAAL